MSISHLRTFIRGKDLPFFMELLSLDIFGVINPFHCVDFTLFFRKAFVQLYSPVNRSLELDYELSTNASNPPSPTRSAFPLPLGGDKHTTGIHRFRASSNSYSSPSSVSSDHLLESRDQETRGSDLISSREMGKLRTSVVTSEGGGGSSGGSTNWNDMAETNGSFVVFRGVAAVMDAKCGGMH